jgi:hypothetical protein
MRSKYMENLILPLGSMKSVYIVRKDVVANALHAFTELEDADGVPSDRIYCSGSIRLRAWSKMAGAKLGKNKLKLKENNLNPSPKPFTAVRP